MAMLDAILAIMGAALYNSIEACLDQGAPLGKSDG